MHRENIRFIIQKEAAYPNRLRKIYDAPYGIFQKGQPYEEKELSIAIVGSRYPTTYGFEISKKFAKELAQQGVQIVSGLARGVDGTVHREIIRQKRTGCWGFRMWDRSHLPKRKFSVIL